MLSMKEEEEVNDYDEKLTNPRKEEEVKLLLEKRIKKVNLKKYYIKEIMILVHKKK